LPKQLRSKYDLVHLKHLRIAVGTALPGKEPQLSGCYAELMRIPLDPLTFHCTTVTPRLKNVGYRAIFSLYTATVALHYSRSQNRARAWNCRADKTYVELHGAQLDIKDNMKAEHGEIFLGSVARKWPSSMIAMSETKGVGL
jgi:hypothetical protein